MADDVPSTTSTPPPLVLDTSSTTQTTNSPSGLSITTQNTSTSTATTKTQTWRDPHPTSALSESTQAQQRPPISPILGSTPAFPSNLIKQSTANTKKKSAPSKPAAARRTPAPAKPRPPKANPPRSATAPSTPVAPPAPPVDWIPQPQPVPFEEDDNIDIMAIRSAISVLQIQRERSRDNIQALREMKLKAVAEPEAFARALARGDIKTGGGGGARSDPLAPTFAGKGVEGFVDRLMSEDAKANRKQKLVEEKTARDAQDAERAKTKAEVKARAKAEKKAKTTSEAQPTSTPDDPATSPANADTATTATTQHPLSSTIDPASDSDSDSSDSSSDQEPGSSNANPFGTIPSAQNVFRMPPVNWDKYEVVGPTLDKIHAEVRARPLVVESPAIAHAVAARESARSSSAASASSPLFTSGPFSPSVSGPGTPGIPAASGGQGQQPSALVKGMDSLGRPPVHVMAAPYSPFEDGKGDERTGTTVLGAGSRIGSVSGGTSVAGGAASAGDKKKGKK